LNTLVSTRLISLARPGGNNRKYLRVLLIGLGWSVYFFIIHHLVYLYIGHFERPELLPVVVPNFIYAREVFTTTLFSFFGGLVIGVVEVFYVGGKFWRASFGRQLLFKTFIYFSLLIIITLSSSIFYNGIAEGLPPWHPETIAGVSGYIQGAGARVIIIIALIGIFINLVLLQITDHIGYRNLIKLLTGYYHRPKPEDRIFMFIDLQDSTSLAEQLGNLQYFRLLNEFFKFAGDVSEEFKGEIYQYVGDEVVLTWRAGSDRAYLRSLATYYQILELLEQNHSNFQENYGLVPAFRAALHGGYVVTAETGATKKEIVFSGDVLNTCSRMLDQGRRTGSQLILSEFIASRLKTEATFLEFKHLGHIPLKGKAKPVSLFTIALSTEESD
jgi:adenylate cyclase